MKTNNTERAFTVIFIVWSLAVILLFALCITDHPGCGDTNNDNRDHTSTSGPA